MYTPCLNEVSCFDKCQAAGLPEVTFLHVSVSMRVKRNKLRGCVSGLALYETGPNLFGGIVVMRNVIDNFFYIS